MADSIETKRASGAGRLFREMLGAAAFYIVATAAAAWAIRTYEPAPPVAALIALASVAPALLMLVAHLRYMRTLDELQRRIEFDAVVIAAAVVAYAALAYGMLEAFAGFPPISLIWVFPALCLVWGGASVFLHLRYR